MKFTVRVPATTANLGSGFDTAGIALSCHNQFEFDFTLQNGIHYIDEKYDFETSLTLDTFFKTLDRYHIKHPLHLTLKTTTNIPVTRGLGSSSTCIVAGVLAANKYADLNLSTQECAYIASKFEGHPDNVVPAITGNLALSIFDDSLYIQNYLIHDDLAFLALIPQYPLSTEKARNALPTSYTLKDITYNLSRVALLGKAFAEGNKPLLKQVTQDRLHQPYRSQLIHNYQSISDAIAKTDAITSWISGAGPTIMVLTQKTTAEATLAQLAQALRSFNLDLHAFDIDKKGASIHMD